MNRESMAIAACQSGLLTVLLLSRASAAELPAADDVLRGVLDRLPRDPVTLHATLETRGSSSAQDRTVHVDVFLSYGSRPSRVVYTVRDAFGCERARLTLTREGAAAPVLRYEAGAPLAAVPAPALTNAVEDTDVTWADLTLAFLWWPGGRTVARDMVKEQACYVLDVPAPAGAGGASYGRVRLWIDEKFHMLLQAEGYDERGQLARRMSVRSFRKMRDKWMVKDLDVQSFPSRRRTTLRVTEIDGPPADAPGAETNAVRATPAGP